MNILFVSASEINSDFHIKTESIMSFQIVSTCIHVKRAFVFEKN
jgi:hypothetical protein